MTGVAEQWRDHDIPGDIRIAPFAILLHRANSFGILAHHYGRVWIMNWGNELPFRVDHCAPL